MERWNMIRLTDLRGRTWEFFEPNAISNTIKLLRELRKEEMSQKEIADAEKAEAVQIEGRLSTAVDQGEETIPHCPSSH